MCVCYMDKSMWKTEYYTFFGCDIYPFNICGHCFMVILDFHMDVRISNVELCF